MELRDFLAIIRKRWTVIVATGMAGLVLSLAVSLTATPIYTASTQLYVSVQGSTSTSEMLQGANFSRQQVASYTSLVNSPYVLNAVVDDLALGVDVGELAERVSASSPLDTSLINIAVTDQSPALAAAIANAIAAEFRDVVAELETPSGGGTSPVKLTIVREAAAPTAPSAPNVRFNALLGILGGIALGLGAAVLRDVLDTRVRGESTIAQVTDAAIVGVIAYDESATETPLIVQSAPNSPRAEAFRRLRTNVQFLDLTERPSTIVLTSSLPGEGKSTTTLNLGIALADAGTRVAIVDADLRRPTIGKHLGLETSAGLTTVLIGKASLDEVLQPWGNGNLFVLPSGQIPPNPSELLGSAAMGKLLEDLSGKFDLVLVDTPPLLPVTDAAILAKRTGGAMVVVGAGRVNRAQLREALGALATVGAHILGVVVNREPRKPGDVYNYYRYSEESNPSVGGSGRPARPFGSAKSKAAPIEAHIPASRKEPGGTDATGRPLDSPDLWTPTGASPTVSPRSTTRPQHTRATRGRR